MNPDTQRQFRTENALEEILIEAKAGRVPLSQFLEALLTSQLYVLSTEEIQQDGRGLVPLIFNRNGTPMAAVFTARSRTKSLIGQAQFLVEMAGKAFFLRIPGGYGVVVNPQNPAGLEITPDGVKEIVRDFAAKTEP